MSNYEKKIYYVTQAQYDILLANGTITVGGISYTGIDPNASYFVRTVPDFYELAWDDAEDQIQLLKNGAITGDPLTVGYASYAANSGKLGGAPANEYVNVSGDQSIQGIKTFTNTIVGSISGNAWTATKLATARTFTVTDNDATNSQAAATAFDGLSAYTIKLPATIKATITGTASGNLTSSSTLDASKLSGTIPSAVLGNSTVYIGSTAVALNRASASLALTGVTNINWDAAYNHSTTTTGSVHGSTTVGGNLLRLANVTTSDKFLRINYTDNSVSALDAAAFRTAIGAGTSSTTGTVTSVGGTGTVSGITLTGTVTSSGNLTLGGSISGLTTSNLSASANIANTQLANSSITVGTTAISLGGSSTTLAGLTSVTATTLTTGAGTQTWQITDSGSDLIFQSGTTPVTKATLYNNGDLTITGKLSATSKSFLIDHPTKPGYKLQYGSLEGPENGVYVRGRLTNSNIIELPEYWTNLVDEDSITVTLTAIGKAQKLFVENIENNKIYIKNSNRIDKNINCFYVVYGERKDVNKLDVEMEVK